MPLPCESFNLKVELPRPDRTGPGQDIVGDPDILETGVDAIFNGSQRVETDVDGSQFVVQATFWIDDCNAGGVARDVKKNDWVQWIDYRGRLQRAQRIKRVTPVYVGTQVDHLKLETIGG